MQSEGRFFFGLFMVVLAMVLLAAIGIAEKNAQFVLLANVIVGIGMMLSGEHPE